jgi:hypothetical protein
MIFQLTGSESQPHFTGRNSPFRKNSDFSSTPLPARPKFGSGQIR